MPDIAEFALYLLAALAFGIEFAKERSLVVLGLLAWVTVPLLHALHVLV